MYPHGDKYIRLGLWSQGGVASDWTTRTSTEEVFNIIQKLTDTVIYLKVDEGAGGQRTQVIYMLKYYQVYISM